MDRGLNTEDQHISTDIYCVTCQYNLRTLPVTGRCPECNTKVSSSLNRKPAELNRRLRILMMIMAVTACGPWFVLWMIRPPESNIEEILMVSSIIASSLVELVCCALWFWEGMYKRDARSYAWGLKFWWLIIFLAVGGFYAYIWYVIIYEAPNWG